MLVVKVCYLFYKKKESSFKSTMKTEYVVLVSFIYITKKKKKMIKVVKLNFLCTVIVLE